MKIVVLDRDGVINKDSDDFVKTLDEWVPLPGSIEAIARLCEHGFTVAVATNQSGIGRGLIDESELEAMHETLLQMVHDAGGDIATIVWCPHKPDDYCDCRKPQSGLFDQIAATLGCELEGAFAVGDSARDLEAGMARGCIPILVRTGKGEKTEEKVLDHPEDFPGVMVFDDLAEAAEYMIQQTPTDIVQEWLDAEY